MNGGPETEGDDHRAIIECLNEIKLTIEPIIKKIKSNQDTDEQQPKKSLSLRNPSQEYDPVTGQYQHKGLTCTLNVKTVNLNQEWDLNQELDQNILSNAYHRQSQNQSQNNIGTQLQTQLQSLSQGELQSQSEFRSHEYISQSETHSRSHSQGERERKARENDFNKPIDPFFIHPLSFPTHQIKNSKNQLINSLKSIKHSITKFHHSVLGPLISHVPPLPEPIPDHPPVTQTQFPKLFSLLRESSRGLNYLMNVKIESEIADQLINHHHSLISSLSPQFIINQSQSASSSFQSQTLHLIELLLRQHSLECFREPDSNLLMIAGKVMVIDLELDPPTPIDPDPHSPRHNHHIFLNSTSNSTVNQDHHQLLNQKVKRCKFSYSFGDEESKRDEDLDKALLDSLQNIHEIHQPSIVLESLKNFSNLLFQLKSIDELIFSQQSQESGVQPIDYFCQFRALIKAFHVNFLEFLKFDCDDSTSLQSFIDLDSPLIDPENLSPYGYPISSPSHFELKIVYHFTAPRLLRFHSKELLKKANHLMTIKFTKPTKLNNYSVDSLFTAVFDPPILVSKPIALELNQITHPHKPKKGKTKIIESDENDLFLDDLLIINQLKEDEEKEEVEKETEETEEVMGFGKEEKEKETKQKIKLKKNELMKEGKWRDDQFGYGEIPLMKFSCIKRNEDLEIKNHLGFSIEEVGFNDLNGLLKIIHISRRQSVLNELFQSCFNSRHYLFLNHDDEHDNGLIRNLEGVQEEKGLLKEEITLDELLSNQKPKSIPIEIILNPKSFQLILQFPSPILPSYQNRLPISINLQIQEDAKIELKVSIELLDCKLKKLGRLVNRTRNLPILLDWFVKELVRDEKDGMEVDGGVGMEVETGVGVGARKRLIGSLSSNNDDDSDRQQEKRKKVEVELGLGDSDTDMRKVDDEGSKEERKERGHLTLTNEQVRAEDKVEDIEKDEKMNEIEPEKKDEKVNEIENEKKAEETNEIAKVKKDEMAIEIEDGLDEGKPNKKGREDEERNKGIRGELGNGDEKEKEKGEGEEKVVERDGEKVEEGIEEKVEEKEKVEDNIQEKVEEKIEEKVGQNGGKKEKDEDEEKDEEKDEEQEKEKEEEKDEEKAKEKGENEVEEKEEAKGKEKDQETEKDSGDDGIRRSKRTKK